MTQEIKPIIILSTAPAGISESLARAVIHMRLAACVNVVPLHSYYTWKGTLCDEEEVLLIIKTTKDREDEVFSAIKSRHPYEVPEIITLSVTGGYIPYLEWVHGETH